MPQFNNVNVIVKKEGITIIGYDTKYHVIIMSKILGGLDVDTAFFIDVKKLKKLTSEFIPGASIQISLSNNNIKIRQETFRVTTRLATESFSDLTKGFPASYDAELEVTKDAFLEALARVAPLSDKDSSIRKCGVRFSDKSIELHLSSKAGENTEIVPCIKINALDGKLPKEMVLNINVLKEVMGTLSTAKCLLSFTTNSKGNRHCYIRPSGSGADNFKCLISELKSGE
jgi:DNA polymerase III sliding clamp (beta) subunit (PCNA family)